MLDKNVGEKHIRHNKGAFPNESNGLKVAMTGILVRVSTDITKISRPDYQAISHRIKNVVLIFFL